MRTLLPLLLAHVPDAGAGTAVGNPTGLTLDTAAGPGLTLLSATADVAAIRVTDRKGTVWTLVYDGPFDLRGGTRVEAPLENAARLEVVLAGPIELSGEGPDGAGFDLALELPSLDVSLAPTGEISDAVLRLGAPGWLSAAGLGLDAGDVEVGEGDPLHDPLVASLVAGTALYRDLDADGRCDTSDDDEDADDDAPDDTPDDDEGEAEDDLSECDGDPLGTAR